MDSRITDPGQEPLGGREPLPEEPDGPSEAQSLKAENDQLWQAVERYAPQIVDLLAEHNDTKLLATVARRLSNSKNDQNDRRLPERRGPAAPDPLQDAADELARQVVDALFAPPSTPPASESSPDRALHEQLEASRLEEQLRQKALRRSTVERGSAERREPAVTLGDKAKEIAQAFGISEEKLARAAAERLRRKGVLRP